MKKVIGEKPHGYHTGRFQTPSGYYYVYRPEHPFSRKDGYIAEHRLIMEEAIGRYLEKYELVHHINHNRIDNRIENLELIDKLQHYHHEKAWPKAIQPTQIKKGDSLTFRKGHVPWNKGLKFTKEQIEKILENRARKQKIRQGYYESVNQLLHEGLYQ